MTKKTRPRFDVEAVRRIAGERSFARGEAYLRNGQATLLSVTEDRILAEVTGTESYRVELSGRGHSIGGSCTCRAFEDYGFCKHMVATALAANASDGDGNSALDRIRAHLRELEPGALVAMIVELAEQDLTLLHRLESAAALTQADDKTLESSLRKAIDRATRTGGYLEYHQVGDWAAGVEAVLDNIATLASSGRSGLALSLIEYVLRRIERAVESIDDSNGDGGALMHRVQEIHLTAVMSARPDPVKLARALFARETEGVYDTFYGAAETYAEALGETGLTEYRRLASEVWSKLPVRMGKQRADQVQATDGFRVAAILDHFAEQDGDVELRIAIRAKDLSSPWRYLELAQFCQQQHRMQEALRYAEEGLWMFEDDAPDERLVSFAVELLRKVGRKEDAAAHLWRAFERRPIFEMYGQLCKLEGRTARARALTVLEAGVVRPRAGSWGNPVDLLVRVLIHEKMFDEAWTAVQRHGVSEEVKEALVRATETIRPNEAIAFYAAKVEKLALSGSGNSYDEAAKLIRRSAKLRNPAEHARYLADIKDRFRRRRNFMKLLD